MSGSLSYSKATGLRLAILLQLLMRTIMTLLVALIYSWLTTLILLAVVPFVAAASLVRYKAVNGQADTNRKALEKASKVQFTTHQHL